MKKWLTFFLLLPSLNGMAQTKEEQDINAIKTIMHQQQQAWSNHDLEGFMKGYWKSDSLTYYSSGKVTKGWRTTLDNYKKGYPTKATTGKLNFQIDDIGKIDEDAYWLMGQYFLSSDSGDANGTFMIIFKRIDGEWKIVADSSC